MSKRKYIKQRLNVYLKNCEEGEILFNFRTLRRLKEQWKFDYEMGKIKE